MEADLQQQQQHHRLVRFAAMLKTPDEKVMLPCPAALPALLPLRRLLLLLLLHPWLLLCWGPFLCACWLLQSLGSWQTQEWLWWVLRVVCLQCRGSN